jgi:hypothetical protein
MIRGHFYSGWGSYSLYVQNQIERYRLSSARQQFEANNAGLVDTLSSVSSGQSQGLAQIAAQRAIDRMNEEAKQKAADAASQLSDSTDPNSLLPVDNNIPSTINSTFSVINSTRLDGGSNIDLNAGTITMKDGTVYDLNTGTKRINVTV